MGRPAPLPYAGKGARGVAFDREVSVDVGVLMGGALAIGAGIMVYRSGRKGASGCGCGCGCGGETLEDEIYQEDDEDRGCCDDDD